MLRIKYLPHKRKSDRKVYHDIGRVKKNFRNKKKPIVIVAGCVAQAEGEILLKKENYIDAVVGPQSYHQFIRTILNIEKSFKKINFTNFEVNEKFDTLNLIKNSDSNVSAFLTIQEGCDKFCKFCVVPYTRGAEFSRSIDELFRECENLVENGSKEITLLGQNVNAYNYNGKKLSDLIYKISSIKKLERIRYTTSHPIDFKEDLIEAHSASTKLMPYIHLPVQSGSNKILRDMNRKHTVEDYLELIAKLKKTNPKIKFSSDFIIGYQVKHKDFNESIKLLKTVGFINSFSFIFSPRPGTPAAIKPLIQESIAKERLALFQKEAEKIKLEYKKSLFKKSSSVLFENQIKNEDKFFGRDEFSNPFIVKSNKNIKGKLKNVKIIDGNQNTLFGIIEQKLYKKDYAA